MTTPPNHNTADQSGADERANYDSNDFGSSSLLWELIDLWSRASAGDESETAANAIESQIKYLISKYAALASTQPVYQEPVAYRRFQKTPKDSGYWVLTVDHPKMDCDALYTQPFPAPAVQSIVPQVVQAPIGIVRQLDNAFIEGKRACGFLFDESIADGTKLYAAPIVATVPSEAIAKAWYATGQDIRGGSLQSFMDALEAAPISTATEQARVVRNAALTVDIEQMVNRFLSWKLPQTFAPDCGILFKQVYADSWPTGTNLFHAGEAKAMFQHCLGIPAAKGNSQDEVKS